MAAIDDWPSWVYEKNFQPDLEEHMLPAEPLLAWVARQVRRLELEGMSWTNWCDLRGITEWRRKKLNRISKTREQVSYAFVDDIVGKAGYHPEDLYDISEDTRL